MEEVDHEDVKFRLFSQILAGEARRWFTSLPDNSILGYQDFKNVFKKQWEERKYPRRCLSQFHSMRSEESESVYEFSDIFMKEYDGIPVQF